MSTAAIAQGPVDVLVGRLRAHAEAHEYIANADPEQRQWMHDLYDAADALERAPRWRDVAEELPQEAQEVLFVRGGKTVHGAWIGGIFWHSNKKMAAAKWMPLPLPPNALMERNEQGQQATPPALPAPETEIDRQKRSRINRRAYELSHRAYETYRDQMMTCHFITRGQIAIEQWLPPHLTENVIGDAESLAKVCRIFADQLAQNAADLARMAGIER